MDGMEREGSSIGHISSSAMSSRTYGQSGLTSPSCGENSPVRGAPLSTNSARQYCSVVVYIRKNTRRNFHVSVGMEDHCDQRGKKGGVTYGILLRSCWLNDARRKPNRVTAFSANVDQNLLAGLFKFDDDQYSVRNGVAGIDEP